MYVSAHVGFFGNDAQCVVAHVLGVTRAETDAHAPHGSCHAAQQGGKVGGFVVVAPLGCKSVRVHVLPQQRHLLVATALEVAHFAQNALHIARPFTASGVGHDAVVAEVVAATHDAHIAANVGAADALGHDVAIGLRSGELDVDGLVPGFGLGDEVGQREVGIGACHEVGMMVVEQVVLHPLCHASQHADNQLAPLAAQGVQRVEAVVYLLLGIVSHTTGVEENGIGIIHAFAQFVSCHLHDRGHYLAVGHVHLAAVCFNQ